MLSTIHNFATINLVLSATSPLLIKASDSGADPTRPDMSFVRTFKNGRRIVYLPGSSLKGVIRSHAERLMSSMPNSKTCIFSSPCKSNSGDKSTYIEVCKICQLFGSTSIASRISIDDALPIDESQLSIEERSGNTIDRKTGATKGGALFNYEVVTSGSFSTTIKIKNFTIEQLALIALTLRDLNSHIISLGFGKGKGFGNVEAIVTSVTINYPLAMLKGETIAVNGKSVPNSTVMGIGAIGSSKEVERYGLTASDKCVANCLVAPSELGIGVSQTFSSEQINSLWKACAESFAKTALVGAKK